MPAVLSSARNHGLENYPDFYTVNSAEATQIMGVANDIIRYMAYGPLSIAKPYQITDDPQVNQADKMQGDMRGLPTSLVYSTKVVRPLTPVYDLMKEEGVTDERLRAAVDYLFEALTFRPPSKEESDAYLKIVKQSIEKLGKETAPSSDCHRSFLDRDAFSDRNLAENGQTGSSTDVSCSRTGSWAWRQSCAAVHQAGRRTAQGNRRRPHADQGRCPKREVERMLADDSIRKPRILRFFRDYFDYDLGGYICKDAKALAEHGREHTRGTVPLSRHVRCDGEHRSPDRTHPAGRQGRASSSC